MILRTYIGLDDVLGSNKPFPYQLNLMTNWGQKACKRAFRYKNHVSPVLSSNHAQLVPSTIVLCLLMDRLEQRVRRQPTQVSLLSPLIQSIVYCMWQEIRRFNVHLCMSNVRDFVGSNCQKKQKRDFWADWVRLNGLQEFSFRRPSWAWRLSRRCWAFLSWASLLHGPYPKRPWVLGYSWCRGDHRTGPAGL